MFECLYSNLHGIFVTRLKASTLFAHFHTTIIMPGFPTFLILDERKMRGRT